MSAISKEKIKIRVLTKIQDIWTEWPDIPINVTVVLFKIDVTFDRDVDTDNDIITLQFVYGNYICLYTF
jgi:hypothetical protein